MKITKTHAKNFSRVARSFSAATVVLVMTGCGVHFNLAQALSSASSVDAVAFTPTSGPVGTILTITSPGGIDLSTVQSITVDGIPALSINASSTQITAMVMPGTATGSVGLSTAAITATTDAKFTVTPTAVPIVQQGAKYVPTGSTGTPHGGSSVAVSADGNTMAMGGYTNNTNKGGVWIFKRSNGAWTQEAGPLNPTDGVNNPYFGESVSLSADGNTALIGGYYDNAGVGGAWVFTRTNGVWSQQGPKLLPNNIIASFAEFGSGVSISPDGNTAAIGGFYDNTAVGAVWIYTRSNGVWSQGQKLIGTGNTGQSRQGTWVSMSGDGQTIAFGGWSDNASVGAVWVFGLSAGTWTQQGAKLTATGEVGAAKFGLSGALSLDGNTLVAGSPLDNGGVGGAWIFKRNAGTWSQLGTKLFAQDTTAGAGAGANQGRGVAISGDGTLIAEGGPIDNGNVGGIWYFTQSGGAYSVASTKLTGTGYVGGSYQGLTIGLTPAATTCLVTGDGDAANIGAFWMYTP
jgi:hypothetical protein